MKNLLIKTMKIAGIILAQWIIGLILFLLILKYY